MMSIWNYKDAPQDLELTLYFSGGQFRIPIHLEARKAYNLDMMTLVHSQLRDPEGKLIPSNITSGSAMLSGKGGEGERISVAVTASVYNVRNATCTITCSACNGITELDIILDGSDLLVGETAQATAVGTLSSGSTVNERGPWSIGDNTVATISPLGGLVTAVGKGTTAAFIDIEDNSVAQASCSGGGTPSCVESPIEASSPVTVSACPSTITVGAGIVEGLAPKVPGILTGIGSYFPMTVGPSSTAWGGTEIYESLTQDSSTTCPSSISGQCVGDSTPFTVGSEDTEFNGVIATATANVFWDQHITVEAANDLAGTGIKSCVIVCSQTYTCGGTPVGSGFTITRTLTETTVGSTAVTQVAVTKTQK